MNAKILRTGLASGTGILTSYAAYCYISNQNDEHSPFRNKSRTGPEVSKACEILKLPTPEIACKIRPVILRNFLSREEVDRLLRSADSAQKARAIGVIERDERGTNRGTSLGGVWRTSYLHTNGWFGSNHCDILDKLKDGAINAVRGGDDGDDGTFSSFLKHFDNLRVRTVELHEYGPKGNLTEDMHYDAGSLITIDVMLSTNGEEYDGGKLTFPSYDGKDIEVLDVANIGDAVIFPSHKFHQVQPVTRGRRKVMILELWDGAEKKCAHRCLCPKDNCDYSLNRHDLGNFGKNVGMLG